MSRVYEVTLTGISPLLMHRDDHRWRDHVKKWQKAPENKGKTVAGDDRTPAWLWLGYAYHEHGLVGIPSDNLMSVIRDGATFVTVSGKKTFKAQSQSGILVNELSWPITNNHGEQIEWEPIADLANEDDFEKHIEFAESKGFELFEKTVRVNQSKHIRVRPRFEKWTASGSITVFDEMITKEVLQMIFDAAGAFCGLCDWRPKSPKSPGPFGRFQATITEVK